MYKGLVIWDYNGKMPLWAKQTLQAKKLHVWIDGKTLCGIKNTTCSYITPKTPEIRRDNLCTRCLKVLKNNKHLINESYKINYKEGK